MDCKNISNLVERYFECNTTAQEEQMLRDYFQNEEVAEELLAYKDLFCGMQDEASVSLPADFDVKIQERIKSQKSKTPFKARIISGFSSAGYHGRRYVRQFLVSTRS